jgi:2,3-dihydroxyphenylpropionate 1,2-dioxygenase
MALTRIGRNKGGSLDVATSRICASHSPLLYCYAQAPKEWPELQQAFAARTEAVEKFDPELVFAFGADHFNGFFLKLMPSFCVGLNSTAVGDIGGFAGALDVPTETAIEAVNFLRANDVDPATSTDMTIDHAFSQTINNMCGGLDARPTIPIFINCICEPFVPFRRSRMMGEAIGRFAQSTGKRVLLLASGGMSHHPRRYYPEFGEGPADVTAWQNSGGSDEGSLAPGEWIDRLEVMHHEGAGMIVRGERTAKDMRLNAASDQRFLDVMTRFELAEFDDWNQHDLVAEAGIGSMELHTWIAASAAHKAAGGEAPELDFYAVTPELGIATGIVHAD